jgi:hypothetical protein
MMIVRRSRDGGESEAWDGVLSRMLEWHAITSVRATQGHLELHVSVAHAHCSCVVAAYQAWLDKDLGEAGC